MKDASRRSHRKPLLVVGTRLQMQAQNGQAIPVVVVDANETTVTLDANHPLAGQDLTFAIELVEIKPAA